MTARWCSLQAYLTGLPVHDPDLYLGRRFGYTLCMAANLVSFFSFFSRQPSNQAVLTRINGPDFMDYSRLGTGKV